MIKVELKIKCTYSFYIETDMLLYNSYFEVYNILFTVK